MYNLSKSIMALLDSPTDTARRPQQTCGPVLRGSVIRAQRLPRRTERARHLIPDTRRYTLQSQAPCERSSYGLWTHQVPGRLQRVHLTCPHTSSGHLAVSPSPVSLMPHNKDRGRDSSQLPSHRITRPLTRQSLETRTPMSQL